MRTAVRRVAQIHKQKGPDKVLVVEQLQALQEMRDALGTVKFIEFMFWIQVKKKDDVIAKLNKGLGGRLVPFKFNKIQLDMHEKEGQYNIWLKARQAGYTTNRLLVRGLLPCMMEGGINSLLMSQTREYVSKHFAMARRADRYFGYVSSVDNSLNGFAFSLKENLLHKASKGNKHEIYYTQLDSRYSTGTAEVEESGQGVTLQHLVCSEVARWPKNPEETIANLAAAVTDDGTIDLESTADGAGGYFFEEYFRAKDGNSRFKAQFHPWWWTDEYQSPLTPTQEKELADDLDAEERALRDTQFLTLNQLAWRREKQKVFRHNFAEKYAEDEITCFLTSGRCFFDKDILHLRQIELSKYKPLVVTNDRELEIYEKPIPGRRYIIGADTAAGKQVSTKSEDLESGVSDTDFNYASVIDEATGKDVARYRSKSTPHYYALDLDDLGRQYNKALLAVERSVGADSGGDGGTVLTILNMVCGYPNLYQHAERQKKGQSNKTVVGEQMTQPGFPMNSLTRPIALNKIKWFVANFPDLIWDIDFINQALVFVRNEKGRPQAQEGHHDDAVMSKSIAHIVRLFVLGLVDPYTLRRERYGDDWIGETPDDESA